MGKGYTSQHHKNKRFAIAFLSLVLVYLVFHLFVSDRSIPSLLSLKTQQNQLQEKLVVLDNDKQLLQRHVTKLQPETLDHDLVEEYAIRMLGHNNAGGMIILQDVNS